MATESSDAADAIEIEPGPGEPPPVPRRASGSDAPAPMSVSRLPARGWPPDKVGDWMTRNVITLRENEPVGDLERWMKRFRFRHLPVVDGDMKLVGLITRTDILHAAAGTGPDGKPTAKLTTETPASAVMNRNVVTAQVDAPLATAVKVMLHEKLGCLPVIREDKVLVGIITDTDFARLALEFLELS